MKEIDVENQYPHRFTLYTDGSAAAYCTQDDCGEWTVIPEAQFSKLRKIFYPDFSHWTAHVRCYKCYSKSVEANKLIQPMDSIELKIRTGQAINLAHAEWLHKAEEVAYDANIFDYIKRRVPELLALINEIQDLAAQENQSK